MLAYFLFYSLVCFESSMGNMLIAEYGPGCRTALQFNGHNKVGSANPYAKNNIWYRTAFVPLLCLRMLKIQ